MNTIIDLKYLKYNLIYLRSVYPCRELLPQTYVRSVHCRARCKSQSPTQIRERSRGKSFVPAAHRCDVISTSELLVCCVYLLTTFPNTLQHIVIVKLSKISIFRYCNFRHRLFNLRNASDTILVLELLHGHRTITAKYIDTINNCPLSLDFRILV